MNPVIKHIFVGTLVDDADPTEVDELLRRWRELPEKIPTIRSLTVGLNVNANDPRYSLGLVADFDDMAACQGYLDHPAHRAVSAEYSSRLIEPSSRAVVQIEF
jgi:hypothetical protein